LEFVQMLAPGRFFELADVAANTWGALLGLSAGVIFRPQAALHGTTAASKTAAKAPRSQPL
ncbi:MAG: hypothetical protein NZM33_17865, partial [Bryobacteraceae bacterium]|nr:hypothetical protein [Bryobacteraceae bacterium]